jgi:hypothetical protein
MFTHRSRVALLAAPLLAATLLVGCGGSDDPATTTTAAKQPAVDAGDAKPAKLSDSKDPVTVKGALGDALTLRGSSTSPDGQSLQRVVVKKIAGPYKGFDVAKGRELVGVELSITSLNAAPVVDPLPNGALTTDGGEQGKQTQLITVGGKNPCKNPSVKLAKGQTKDVCIAYEVPAGATLKTFQFETDAGYGDSGLWTVS